MEDEKLLQVLIVRNNDKYFANVYISEKENHFQLMEIIDVTEQIGFDIKREAELKIREILNNPKFTWED